MEWVVGGRCEVREWREWVFSPLRERRELMSCKRRDSAKRERGREGEGSDQASAIVNGKKEENSDEKAGDPFDSPPSPS